MPQGVKGTRMSPEQRREEGKLRARRFRAESPACVDRALEVSGQQGATAQS